MAIRTMFVITITLFISTSTLSSAQSSCPFSGHGDHGHNHDHDHHGHVHSHSHDHAHDGIHSHSQVHHHHGHEDDHHHHHHEHLHQQSPADGRAFRLAEEIAEEEELKLYGFASDSHWDEHGHHHHHEHTHIHADLGLWVRALGCSLLVSLASLICLIILPLVVAHGRPSRTVVDFLAAFGAGAMLGDAFLHQLPHALGGGHSHSPNHSHDGHDHGNAGSHGHAHSIQDLSVGLAILAGILLFFIVEKIVRQTEKSSSKGSFTGHHHHHHHSHGHNLKNKEEDEDDNKISPKQKNGGEKEDESKKDESKKDVLRRRNKKGSTKKDENDELHTNKSAKNESESTEAEKSAPPPNMILGYLNLFSDGVHNFTDGMALGSAFLNHGIIGGWSRTLFLLAHEIPQEVGDFGILVQSGFSVFKALAFNFLSALVALAGTALALLVGGSPEQSSLIEGFTAGGFIYIAVAGVLPEMHQTGTSAKITFLQLTALSLGMSVALVISLVE